MFGICQEHLGISTVAGWAGETKKNRITTRNGQISWEKLPMMENLEE